MGKQRDDLKKKAYDYIRDKIVKCEWMPEDDISEDEIVKHMGISRTPVREALLKLENEKLVAIYPRKGIFVSSISIAIINSVFQVREIVEPQVLRQVMGRLPQDWLMDMKQRFMVCPENSDALSHHINIDREFHSYLVRASENIYLIQLMDSIFAQDERIRVLSWKYVKKVDVTNREHIEIIEAVMDKNADKAEEKMRNHIRNARIAAFQLASAVG